MEELRNLVNQRQHEVDLAKASFERRKVITVKQWCEENPGFSEQSLLDYVNSVELVWPAGGNKSESEFWSYLKIKLQSEQDRLDHANRALYRAEDRLIIAERAFERAEIEESERAAKRMRLEPPVTLRLQSAPVKASAFVASGSKIIENCVVNGIRPVTFNLPLVVVNALNYPVSDDELLEAKTAAKDGRIFTIFPVKVSETTVDMVTGSSLRSFFYSATYRIRGRSYVRLSQLFAHVGPATEDSIPDVVCVADSNYSIPLAVLELIDTTMSPLELIGQAFASGCKIIISHRRLGIKTEDCAVPFVVTNGHLYQFGWISVLEPCLPVLHVTSRVLDSYDCGDVEIIALNLACVKSFCARTSSNIVEHLEQRSMQSIDISLNTQLYHRKNKDKIFDRYDEEDINKILEYHWLVYEALKDVEEVVKPLGYSCLVYDSKKNEQLIFPNLQGFAMGVPADAHEFNLYLQALKAALKKIHACRVVHIDLYPSNILWKLGGDDNKNVIIKIVDWDAATFEGEQLSKKMVLRLEEKEVSQYYYYTGKNQADRRCDYWFLFILSNLTETEKESMKGDATNVNKMYIKCVDRQIADCGGTKAQLMTQFESWFENNEM